ncbi:unnamed protein product, partial [Allacma fusca]
MQLHYRSTLAEMMSPKMLRFLALIILLVTLARITNAGSKDYNDGEC